MPRIFKLLLPLALFLGLPFLLDDRVRPSSAPRGGPSGPAAKRTEVVGYRYTHYDPHSGARVFELHGERAVEAPSPANSRQRRFTLHGLRVILAKQAGRGAEFTPVVLSAPGGAFRFGEGGDTLVNLDGGVRGEAADGTVFTTDQIRVTVAEEKGALSEVRAPGAVRVEGPGLTLEAASGGYTPGGGWVLDGPCTGTLTQRDVGDPKATAELQRSVIGLHAPQGLGLQPGAAPVTHELKAEGGLVLDRRAGAGGPVQSILCADSADVALTAGGVSLVSVRNNLRAAAIAPDGRCDAVVAAASGAWTPDGALRLTGRPRWYLRSGAPVWTPGEARPEPLPDQPLAPAGEASGWMASALQRMTAERHPTDGSLTMKAAGDARIAAVRLTEAHPATRALAPIPEQVRADPLAIAAYLANRNLQDEPGDADGEVWAQQIQATWRPPRSGRRIIDFEAQEDVRVTGAEQGLLATGGRAQGRFTTDGVVRTVAAEMREKPAVQFHAEPGRALRVGASGSEAAVALESTTAGTQRNVKVTASDGVKLLDLRGDTPVADWRADRATVELKRGDGSPEVTSLLAQGNVRASATGRRGGEERAEAALDELRVLRTLGLRGEGRDVWIWRGLKKANAPAAALFDLDPKRDEEPLPGPEGARWNLDARDGQIERWLKQEGKRWEPRKTVATLQGPAVASLKPATEEAAADAFDLTARDGATLEFHHHGATDEAKAWNELRSADLPKGGTYRSASMQIAADRLLMEQGPKQRTWRLEGTPVAARFRAGGAVPLTTTRVPGGKKPGEEAAWFDARAQRVEVTQQFEDERNQKLSMQRVVLSGDPVIGQLPAGGGEDGAWPVPEWELRSSEPIELQTAGTSSTLQARGGVQLTNYDAFGVEQGRLRAPEVVVETDAGGATTATFGAPFAAEGVTAADAYAALGEAGGGDPVKSERVRLISRSRVTVTRAAGTSEVEIQTPALNLLPLDASGQPVRPVRIPAGVRVIPAKDGSWTFAFLGENAAAVPLDSTELEELAKLAKGG